MSSHPAISPTATHLSESWWVESSNPAIRYVQVLVGLVKYLRNYDLPNFQIFLKINIFFENFEINSKL